LDAVLPLLHRGGTVVGIAALVVVVVAVVVWSRVRKRNPATAEADS